MAERLASFQRHGREKLEYESPTASPAATASTESWKLRASESATPPAWIDQSAAGTGLASDVSGSESRPTWPAAQSASQLARARRAMRPCFHSASAYHA